MESSNKKHFFLHLKDHSVSGEDFHLKVNAELDMLETYPQPSIEALPSYYESDDYISHTDAKRNFFENIYHLIRRVALQNKVKLISNVCSNKGALLDVGCGTGDFLEVACKAEWDITGIEPNAAARQVANKKTNQSVIDSTDISKLNTNSYDVITLWHVLEHLPDLDTQLDIYKNLLKLKGTLIIAVPNYKSYDAELYAEYWAAYDVPRHLWHFSQSSMRNFADRIGMKVIKTIPMKFDAFYVSLLSEKYKTGKMNYFKGFRNGLCSNYKARRSGEYSSLIYVLKRNEK